MFIPKDTFTLDEAITLVTEDIRLQKESIDSKHPLPQAWGNVPAECGKTKCRSMEQYALMLSALVDGNHSQCGGDVVEIGTDYCLSTFAMSHGIRRYEKVRVFSFDNRARITASAQKRAEMLGASNITFVHGTSNDLATGKYGTQFSLAYIDGGHLYEDCLTDLKNVIPLMHENGLIVCHDLFFIPKPGNNGVREAILEAIKQNPEWVAARVGGFGLLGKSVATKRLR